MSTIVRADNLSIIFGETKALDAVSFELEQGKIYGLLGRNGSGKTTLLSAIAGLVNIGEGALEVLGQNPKSPKLTGVIHYSRTGQNYADYLRVKDVLTMCSLAHPGWKQNDAEQILSDFGVNLRAKANKLSDGGKSALGIAMALASCAPLTLMDEPYSGLDPVARGYYYQRVKKAADSRRTFVISTHLIDEATPLLDRVLLLQNGQLALAADAFEATTVAHEIAGHTDNVNVYLARAGLEQSVIQKRTIGSITTAQLAAELTEERRELAMQLAVNISPIELQDSVAAYDFAHRVAKSASSTVQENKA